MMILLFLVGVCSCHLEFWDLAWRVVIGAVDWGWIGWVMMGNRGLQFVGVWGRGWFELVGIGRDRGVVCADYRVFHFCDWGFAIFVSVLDDHRLEDLRLLKSLKILPIGILMNTITIGKPHFLPKILISKIHLRLPKILQTIWGRKDDLRIFTFSGVHRHISTRYKGWRIITICIIYRLFMETIFIFPALVLVHILLFHAMGVCMESWGKCVALELLSELGGSGLGGVLLLIVRYVIWCGGFWVTVVTGMGSVGLGWLSAQRRSIYVHRLIDRESIFIVLHKKLYIIF